jgi:hypothetical protein
MGLSNTVATLPGIISPLVTGFVVQHKVQYNGNTVCLGNEVSKQCKMLTDFVYFMAVYQLLVFENGIKKFNKVMFSGSTRSRMEQGDTKPTDNVTFFMCTVIYKTNFKVLFRFVWV